MTPLNPKKSLELSGITTDDGRVGRRVPPIKYWVPKDIRLEKGRLVWGDTHREDLEQVATSPQTIDGFLRLSDATPDEIFRYARRWGPIGFCKHGLPASHNSRWRLDRAVVKMCPPCGGTNHLWEPLEFWRMTAKRATSLLSIAAALYDDKSGSEEDWKIVERGDLRPVDIYDWPIVNQRFELEWHLTHWMQMGRLIPIVTFDKKVLSFSLDVLNGSGLFGALGLQLALAASRTDGLASCFACRRPFIPSRRPKANQHTYCPECREIGRPTRDASRAYRQRKDKQW
jgi:hypothetical protein